MSRAAVAAAAVTGLAVGWSIATTIAADRERVVRAAEADLAVQRLERIRTADERPPRPYPLAGRRRCLT